MKNLLTLVTVSMLAVSCGKGSDDREASSFIDDDDMGNEVAEANIADGVAALSDANDDAAASAALLLADANDVKDVEKERSCAVSESSAVVTVKKTINRSITRENERRKMEHTMEGNNSIIRTWSSANGPIACNDNGKSAAIDWSGDVSGLKLKAEFERSMEIAHSLTHFKSGKSFSMNKSRSAIGTRNVEWTSSTEAEGVITREKTLISDVTRKHVMTKVDGSVKEMEMNVATAEGAPLGIKVLRDAESLALKEKTIASGTIVAQNADGKVETKFSNVKMVFNGSSCSVDSGTVETSIYKASETEPSRKLKLVITAGDGVLTDETTGEEVADFAMPACSLADFQN